VLGTGLREMAKQLDVSPPHLTDMEFSRRTPSDELPLRIAKAYNLDDSELRAGFGWPDTDVAGLASGSPTAAAKPPVFLRTATDLSPGAWDKLIKQAEQLSQKSQPSKKQGGGQVVTGTAFKLWPAMRGVGRAARTTVAKCQRKFWIATTPVPTPVEERVACNTQLPPRAVESHEEGNGSAVGSRR